jgi:hypothetical protein
MKVNQQTSAIIILILFIILLLVIAYFGTGILVRRATRSVINTFRDNGATSPEKALTLDQMGIKGRSLLQFKAFRDYRPAALQFLMRNNIVQATEDGRFYLSEEVLYQSGIEQNIGGQKR